jgi:hypothetical protein
MWVTIIHMFQVFVPHYALFSFLAIYNDEREREKIAKDSQSSINSSIILLLLYPFLVVISSVLGPMICVTVHERPICPGHTDTCAIVTLSGFALPVLFCSLLAGPRLAETVWVMRNENHTEGIKGRHRRITVTPRRTSDFPGPLYGRACFFLEDITSFD